MITYKKIVGAVAQEGAKVLNVTPEGVAMGNIPKWTTLIDPSQLASPTAVKNRARRISEYNNGGQIGVSAFPNGAPAFNVTNDTQLRLTSDNAVDPNEWTVFCVLTYDFSSAGAQNIVSAVNTSVTGIPLSISYSQDGARMFINETANLAGAVRRLSVDVDLSTTGMSPQFFMFTFSIQEGLKMFRNGDLIGANPTDTRPLSAAYGAGEWEMFRRTRGMFGMSGVLGVDISKPEYVVLKSKMDTFMLDKYSIV